MTEEAIANLLTQLAAVVALSVAYGKAFAAYQVQLVEWMIAAFAVKSRYRGLWNLAMGVALALAFTGLAAWQVGDWAILAVGALAGVLASVEAARVHDQAALDKLTSTDQAAERRAGVQGTVPKSDPG